MEKPLLVAANCWLCLAVSPYGSLGSFALKELPQLLGWCKPFVHPLKTRTLETNCVWEQVRLPICVLKILILFLVRMLFVQWQGWKLLPKNRLPAKFFVFQILFLLRNFPERCVEVISVMKHTFVYVHIQITCNYPVYQFLLYWDKKGLIQVF